MTKVVKNYINDESGATAIEYALIAALVGLAIVTGARSLGIAVNARFETVAVDLGAA